MTPHRPKAQLIGHHLHSSAPGRFAVRCPHCGQIHSHRWNGGPVRYDATASCSSGREIRMYRVDLSGAFNPDDNAIDDPVPNWTE